MIRASLAFIAVVAGVGCSRTEICLTDAQRTSSGWSAAEQLFRGDRRWLGGDSAYSIDLGGGRVLWIFNDTFVSPDGSGSRSGAPFARNTVAIQHGYDPASATIDFHYKTTADGTPTSFFPADKPDTWFWPGDGARIGNGVLFIFLSRISSTGSGALDLRLDASEARLIQNPDDAPNVWAVTNVAVPSNPWGIALSEGAVLVEGDHLYAFAIRDPGDAEAFVARFPLTAVASGRLDDPEWATTEGTWTPQSQMTGPPLQLFAGHTEYSVFFDAATKQYVQIQATGFPGDIMMRTSPAITGPWSSQRAVYHPPEETCHNVITYAGKAHPELASPDLAGRVALSYGSNSFDFASVVNDRSLYFPRFVRLDVAAAIAVP
jgi:hypothetical protein